MQSDRHWVLVGLMGSGKTTVGQLLARQSGRPFVDNDAQLLEMTGKTARAVQAERGAAVLHDLERRAVLDALEGSMPAVIAAAASVIEGPDVRARLRRDALVIWLKADVDELARRVGNQPHRPLPSDPALVLHESLMTRSSLLADAADLVIDAAQPPAVIVDALLAEIEGAGQGPFDPRRA
jgi:shikimate kinase